MSESTNPELVSLKATLKAKEADLNARRLRMETMGKAERKESETVEGNEQRAIEEIKTRIAEIETPEFKKPATR